MVVTVPTLIITGPVGVGKTSVANELSNLLEELTVPHVCVDMDALRSAYPPPPNDRFNLALGYKNLSAVWENCRLTGATHLVLADVIESSEQRSEYQDAVPGAAVLIARLRASASTLTARVGKRELGHGYTWHAARAIELAAQMDRDQLEDFVVETEQRTVTEIAQAIVDRIGWCARADQEARGNDD